MKTSRFWIKCRVAIVALRGAWVLGQVLVLLLAGCAVQPVRRPVAATPPLPMIVNHIEGRAVIAPPAPRPLTLAWSHPQEAGDQYQIWRSVDLQHWQLVDTTPNQSWPIPVPPNSAYFKVRATNIYSHQVSEWATK